MERAVLKEESIEETVSKTVVSLGRLGDKNKGSTSFIYISQEVATCLVN